jgi:hypothetical protein
MSAIEHVMLGLVRSVAEGNPPVLAVRNRRDWKNVSFRHWSVTMYGPQVGCTLCGIVFAASVLRTLCFTIDVISKRYLAAQ